MKRNVLITGAAGFIGAATTKKFILNGDNVIGIDNLCKYYDAVFLLCGKFSTDLLRYYLCNSR